ncbi:MAG: hypothetical protein HY713_05950 [candidate division NC10 bacterium]|nr:hypothetical protein [candidate division NC10 bacterium]
MTKAWPWTRAFVRQLHQLRPAPFRGTHILFGSDYSGDHSGSRFRVYGFVIADADASPEWPARCREVRRTFLRDGRRMSFKNLNDGHRRRALVPFLEAAEYPDGHVVAVVVSKDLVRSSTGPSTLERWARLHRLEARWDTKSFEQMARVAHFFSLFVAAWSSPGTHVSWVTDDDSIVANAGRLEDAHQLAARLSGLYVPHHLGEFMMNTVAVDTGDRGFEDFVAIPDLAAGMLTEVMSGTAEPASGGLGVLREKDLSDKSDVIVDWFWYHAGLLKKTCILIDRADEDRFGIGELRLGQ